MKKIICLLLSATFLALLLPQSTFARPLTEYNEENRIELNNQFYDYFQTFPQFHINDKVSVDHPYYAEFLYLKNKNLLEDWLIDNIDKEASYADVAKVMNPFIALPPTPARSQYPDNITQHPDSQTIIEAIEKKIIPLHIIFSINPDLPIDKQSLDNTFTRLGIEKFSDQEYITVGKVLKKIVQYAKLQEKPYVDYTKHVPRISIDEQDIYVDEHPFYGICANWLIQDGEHLGYQEIRTEILLMKEMGIRCISTEIGWDKVMPTEQSFIIPPHIKNFFTISAKEGMLVNLLLSPHYTPEWLFQKYSDDIRMVDIYGVPQEEGEYITYSLHSPAVEDQIAFQQKAIQKFSEYNNILSFLLSNEISYGRIHDLDYSDWAQQAWEEWLVSLGEKIRPIPREKTDDDYKMWKRFRQIALNDYFNTTYRAAVDATTRYIPISHKNIPYEATSYFAPDYGIHPSPLEIEGDIIATDVYGVSPNTYAIHHSFNKPIMVIETNLPGDWDAESMYHYLFMNFLHGMKIQSIFQWNQGTHPNVMFYFDGEPWQKTPGIAVAAHVISSIHYFATPVPTSAIILPTHTINLEGKDYYSNHHLFDDNSLYLFEKTRIYPTALWIDDLTTEGYYEKDSQIYSLENLSNLEYIMFRETEHDSLKGTIFDGHVTKSAENPYLWTVNK